tara:strand:+ start:17741 stop:17983 length:243 start_codon:yes stop_codon:yes gene_type:complete
MTSLKYDYKRTAIDIEGYELYQDLNNPKKVLLVKITTVGNVTRETYYIEYANTNIDLDSLWNNRNSQTFLSLIDVFSENK